MRLFAGVVAAVVLAVSPLATAAAAPVSKAQIATALSQHGYSVRDFRSNMLAVDVGQYAVLIAIDGGDGDISFITYMTGLTINNVGHEFLSKFNSEVKFGRAYVDRDGDITLQMDRNAVGGISLQNIESDFDVFLLLISKFLSDLESRASA
ncbi:MAG: YbjN domain-containing protein [Parvularculaceae bacterium]